MARTNSPEGRNGYDPIQSRTALRPLGIRHLYLRGADLVTEGVAGVLVETGRAGCINPRFFGSEIFDTIEGISDGNRYSVKLSLLDERGTPISLTLTPLLGKIELILQNHLPR